MIAVRLFRAEGRFLCDLPNSVVQRARALITARDYNARRRAHKRKPNSLFDFYFASLLPNYATKERPPHSQYGSISKKLNVCSWPKVLAASGARLCGLLKSFSAGQSETVTRAVGPLALKTCQW